MAADHALREERRRSRSTLTNDRQSVPVDIVGEKARKEATKWPLSNGTFTATALSDLLLDTISRRRAR